MTTVNFIMAAIAGGMIGAVIHAVRVMDQRSRAASRAIDKTMKEALDELKDIKGVSLDVLEARSITNLAEISKLAK